MNWISVDEKLPENGDLVLVAAWEFGFPTAYILARFHQLKNNVTWMLDRNLYNLERPYYIGQIVKYWQPITDPQEIKKPKQLEIIEQEVRK